MTRARRTIAVVLWAGSASAAAPALAEVHNPLVAAGGAVHADGTILALGDFAIGTTGAGGTAAHQGAVPCWLLDADCPGDLDGDRDVDVQDLATLLAHFGTPTGAGPEDGDSDGDGDVDLADLTALLAHFGSTCP